MLFPSCSYKLTRYLFKLDERKYEQTEKTYRYTMCYMDV